MTEFNKTLAELWEESGRKPFKAETADGTTRMIYGLDLHGDAVVYEGLGNYDVRGGHDRRWRLHVPAPVMVDHWPAVVDWRGYYAVTDALFPSVEAAREEHSGVIRLATEYPPVKLEVKP